MSTKVRVRIIKRAERGFRQEEDHAGKRLKSAARSASETSRDAAAAITEWIAESRRKRSVEAAAARAFKNLFTEAA